MNERLENERRISRWWLDAAMIKYEAVLYRCTDEDGVPHGKVHVVMCCASKMLSAGMPLHSSGYLE
jgi:hypothetical protein